MPPISVFWRINCAFSVGGWRWRIFLVRSQFSRDVDYDRMDNMRDTYVMGVFVCLESVWNILIRLLNPESSQPDVSSKSSSITIPLDVHAASALPPALFRAANRAHLGLHGAAHALMFVHIRVAEPPCHKSSTASFPHCIRLLLSPQTIRRGRNRISRISVR